MYHVSFALPVHANLLTLLEFSYNNHFGQSFKPNFNVFG